MGDTSTSSSGVETLGLGKGPTVGPTLTRSAARRRALWLALVGTLAVAVAGCGGDDRLTREELIEEADATCAEYDQRIEELEEPESLSDIEGYLEEVRPIVEEGTDQLAELDPPEELQDEYDAWIDATRANVDRFDELEEAAASGDEQQIQEALESAGTGGDEAARLADELGFEECGDDS